MWHPDGHIKHLHAADADPRVRGPFPILSTPFTETGAVTLRTRLLVDEPGRVCMRFEVEDTGIGISQDAQEKLFSPFEQANISISRKYGGTGLGLALCQRLVEAAPGLHLLVTSQAPLKLAVEHVYRLDTLAVPAAPLLGAILRSRTETFAGSPPAVLNDGSISDLSVSV